MDTSVSRTLRKALQGMRWCDLCRSTANINYERDHIWFYGRSGCFLGRACVAVCAKHQFVVLRYMTRLENLYDKALLKSNELDGLPSTGLTLFEHDLHLIGIKPESLILGPDDMKGE